ncbi:unnamed protein product [Paramecium primaurelia]|uniref:Serine aminopeptidase S33 domain-containing protein n=1 Tax=Paramecium primaurelia TaxID=5886 RepID=A0A8S1K4A7_PARPR|nr:unnamed protein product [Paramecium primaurelia]
MKYFQNGINQICAQIIRPLRAEYQQYDLGPIQDLTYTRNDFDLINHCQQRIKVSLFQGNVQSDICIIYLHSANGCRLEALRYVNDILNQNYMFLTFDFTGSGISDGNQVTYGYREIYDLQTVITHISQYVKTIILWGRSMGSVVALLYMQQFQNVFVKCLILDSPFICLQDIVVQMASKRTKIPNFILNSLSSYVSDEIKNQCGFTLNEINCLNNIKFINIPAFFITSKIDTVVSYEQTEKLYNNYQGIKTIYYTNQDHNETRDFTLVDQIMCWLNQQLQSVGQRIKKQIIFKDHSIPIKLIDLNSFNNKERSSTFDDNRIMSISPKQKITNVQQRFQQVLQTQRSAFIERSISTNKMNVSIDVYDTNQIKLMNQNKIKQQNYYNQHTKPITFTKVPNKTRDSSHHRY